VTFLARRATALAALIATVVAPSAQAQVQGNADLKAISAYSLSMPRYKQYLAAMLSLRQAAESDPSIGESMGDSGNLSIDQIATRYNRHPAVKGSITKAGLTARDFALLQGALLQAGMAYGIMKQYKIPADSVVKTTGVSRANLDFFAQNEPELTRLNQEMEAKSTGSDEASAGDKVDEADSASGE
jgi:hypothetical protein